MSKLKKLKEKLLKDPFDDKAKVFESIIKGILNGEDLSSETGADENFAYRIDDKVSRSMKYLNAVYSNHMMGRALPDETLKNNIKKGIRAALMRRDLALLDILSSRLHLEDDVISAMEEGAINALIQYYMTRELGKAGLSSYDDIVSDDDVMRDKERIISDYNLYAKKNKLSKIKPDDEDAFVRHQILIKRRKQFEESVVNARNEIYDNLIKKYNIEESDTFWD